MCVSYSNSMNRHLVRWQEKLYAVHHAVMFTFGAEYSYRFDFFEYEEVYNLVSMKYFTNVYFTHITINNLVFNMYM